MEKGNDLRDMVLVAFIQTVLHYLAWLGFILAGVVLIFGNVDRAKELAIGAIGFFVLKYLIGLIYFLAVGKKLHKVK